MSINNKDYNIELDNFTRELHKQEFSHEMCGSCRKVHLFNGSCQLPTAPYYVLANDSFMSNWRSMDGKRLIVGKNVIVVPCASYEEALKVSDWISDNRAEMKYVRIVGNKPKSTGRKLSLIMDFRYHALNRKIPRFVDNTESKETTDMIDSVYGN